MVYSNVLLLFRYDCVFFFPLVLHPYDRATFTATGARLVYLSDHVVGLVIRRTL